MESRWKSTWQKYSMFLLPAAFILGIVTSAGWETLTSKPLSKLSLGLRESTLNKTNGYTFIDPLLAMNDAGISSASEDNNLESSMRSFISGNINQGKLGTASVIFIDEAKGSGFIINPDEKYSPASLLKVPTMIAYYKLAETDPSILSKKILYAGGTDYNLQEHIQSPVQLVKGTAYTIDDLIQHMIKYSDNNAATLLIDNLNNSGNDSTTFNRLFNDMGITQISLDNDFITVEAYSLFFRILYNATYLNRDYSEKALRLLSETDFSKGIESGVPNNIEVSQKFGEFTIQTTAGQLLKRELHNCGIVYYPSHPYLICIMTKGSDFTNLEQVIATISRQAFEYIEGRYPGQSAGN